MAEYHTNVAGCPIVITESGEIILTKPDGETKTFSKMAFAIRYAADGCPDAAPATSEKATLKTNTPKRSKPENK